VSNGDRSAIPTHRTPGSANRLRPLSVGIHLHVLRLKRQADASGGGTRAPGWEGPDHPVTIDPGKPSRPGRRGQCRSASGVLHIDHVGQARFTHRRVDGDGMIRRAGWGQEPAARARGVPDRTVNRGESGSLTGTPEGR
jgi:hypothetical protein